MSCRASLLSGVFAVLLAGCGPSSRSPCRLVRQPDARRPLEYQVVLTHGTVTTGRLAVLVTNAGV